MGGPGEVAQASACVLLNLVVCWIAGARPIKPKVKTTQAEACATKTCLVSEPVESVISMTAEQLPHVHGGFGGEADNAGRK
jgi:hypothetical protein